MAETHLVNIGDRPNISSGAADGKSARYLGRQGDKQEGPFVYYREQKKGAVVPFHRHIANRTEFLIDGSIEWREKGKEPKIYGGGTLSYVEAGTLYSYEVLEDCRILTVFDGSPVPIHE